jgi:DNA polymerase III delta prime subunit
VNVSELENVQTLHHAYLVVGDAEGGVDTVLAILEKRGVKTVGNLDVLVLRYADMAVDDVRDVITPFSSLNPLGDAKYCVVSFKTANRNAQNALLKIIEEAPGKTIFFFSVDVSGIVLPTVRSRSILLSSGTKAHTEGGEEAEAFLAEAFAKRLLRIEKLVGEVSKTQDRRPVRAFVRALLRVAREKRLPKEALRDTLDVDAYLRLSGSSPKILLSHLAVTLPRV